MQEINPEIISGSRLRADELGTRHFDSNGHMMGDYEQGWERKLPEKPLKNDWECVMTVPENQWGYHSEWRGYVKSANEIIGMVIRCAALGGNYMLNFGPKGDGSVRDEEVKLASGIGEWMNLNGEMIYDCDDAGLERQDWGYFTRKRNSNTIYMGVLNLPVNFTLPVILPKGAMIDSAEFLSAANGKLKVEQETNNSFLLHIPKKVYYKPFVIKLKVSSGNKDNLFYVAPKI